MLNTNSMARDIRQMMNIGGCRFIRFAGFLCVLASGWVWSDELVAREFSEEGWNFWPLTVRTPADSDGRPLQTDFLGPIASERIFPSRQIVSFRPLYTAFHPSGNHSHWHLVYPFFNYYDHEHGYFWHSFNLVRSSRSRQDFQFDAFPFVFLRHSEDPRSRYFAVWPLGGTLKQRFGREQIDFAAWPVFVRTRRDTETRFHTPYPFVQTLTGPESRGFGLWPLFGHFRRDDHYERTWALWPLIYHYRDGLDREVPYVRSGFLPLFHRETALGMRSATFVWPFFGYTIESEPRPRYTEARLLWPFWIQGRGDERHVNRWLPLFSHETRPGYEKRWIGWPVWKSERELFANMEVHTDSVLFFLFRDRRYRSDSFAARETFLWPLFGYWNNGEGQRQFQALDPLNIFFTGNEKVRENWSPLFAFYRYDARSESTRHSLFWNLLVIEHGPDRGLFQFGPIFEVERCGDSRHWQLLKGFFGMGRDADGRRLRLLWNEF